MLNTKTKTEAVHTTSLTFESPMGQKDGGKAWLREAFDLINKNKQVGALTVNFGLGGSISGMSFVEKEIISQKDIEFPAEPYKITPLS